MYFHMQNFYPIRYPYELKGPSYYNEHDKIKLYGSGGNSSVVQLYCLQKGVLDSFSYTNGRWIQEHFHADIHARQLFFDDIANMMIAKTEEGITFYHRKNNEFRALIKSDDFEENIFNDFYHGWNANGSLIRFGRYYHDSSLVGILTYNSALGINLYAIMADSILDGEYPISVLRTDLSIFGNCSQAKFALSDLKQTGQENIIVHSNSGLNVYVLNEDNDPEHLMHVPNTAKPDDSEEELFFPNLTGHPFRNIVLLNSSGLFAFQYNYSNYELIDYQPMFAKLKGWRQEHTDSVQFEDIDLDGRQDLIFTGPQGINLLSFNNNDYSWKSLLDSSQLTISELHSGVMKVIPASPPITQYPIVFIKVRNQLHWANIVEVKESLEIQQELQTHNNSFQVKASPVIPQISKLDLDEEEKCTILLRDQLDYSSIIDAVDGNTGKPRFKLMLVDSSNLKIGFFYDGSSQVSDGLGLGWSWPKNYITMDHQSSVFPEDEKYYFILQDSRHQLTFDVKNSTDNVYFFKLLNGHPDSHIAYHKNQERWEIDIEGVRQIYGRALDDSNDSIGWSLSWKNWRGVGSSSAGQEQFANVWYLSEVRDEYANVLRCTYDMVSVSVPGGKSFTRDISLKTISDNQGTKIIFNYFGKDKSEYDSADLVDQKGNFNTQMVQAHYLGGYTLTTSSYQQVINFIYDVKDGKRFLMKINQNDDITNQSILKFSYMELAKSHMLERVVLPTGATVQFDYKMLRKVSSINEERGQRYIVEEIHRVDYGADYVLVSYIDKIGQVVLRMFNREMTEELYTSLTVLDSLRLPRLGKGLTKFYEILLGESFFVAVLYYDSDKEVCLLRRDEGKWLPTSKDYKFSKMAVIRLRKDVIVVIDNNSIEEISWNKDSKEWGNESRFAVSSTNKEPVLITMFDRGFLFYDNKDLSIKYTDREGRWKNNTIETIPGVITDIRKTVEKFNLPSTDDTYLFDLFKKTALQIRNNFLFLNRWETEGMKLYSVIDLFVIDSSYKLAEHTQRKFLLEDLNQLSHWEGNGTSNSIKLAYEIVNDKFKVTAKDIRGSKYDEIQKQYGNRNKRKDAIESALKDITEQNSQNRFLLSPDNYRAYLHSQVVVCKNKNFTFTGEKWKEDTVSETELNQEKLSYPLGKKFVLRKNDLNSSVKLYKKQLNDKEKLVLDLQVKQLNQVLIKYPFYLAYHQNGIHVSVVEFANDESIGRTYSLPSQEQLSLFSNYQTLITSIDDNFNGYSKTLIFRQLSNMRLLPNNPVVTQAIVSFGDNNKRITGFAYNEAKVFGNTVYYGSISIFPGNDKRSFGWLEETTDFDDQFKTEKRIFNSSEGLIKIEKSKGEQAGVDEDNLYLNNTILDKTGKLEVAQFFPYEIADDKVGYYGFEGYEVNAIGRESSAKKWAFDEEDIVKDGFSFTGRNHLRLSGKSLEGTFKTTDQIQWYVASCWMRSQSKIYDLGALVPYLKAVVKYKNVNVTLLPLGEVKFKLGGWFYAEVMVDLNEIQTNEILVKQEDFSITISIAPDSNTIIDIDHVRFSPLIGDFKANGYDSKTKQVKEVITADGLIERYIYDKYKNRIAVISGNGEPREFSTYTKASSIGRITELKCKVEIQPESGFYEDFAPYSFHERWQIDSADAWQISPSQLQHLTNNSHTLQLNSYNTSHSSYGMRLYFSLQSGGAVINFNDNLKVIRTGNRAEILFSGRGQSVPLDGELLVVTEGRRVFVWVDGGLYFDSFLNVSLFNLEISGRTKISDIIVLGKPNVQVTYLNALDEELQEIVLEAENTSIVTQYLYDKLGRKTITTKQVRIESSNSQSLLAYYPGFINNGNPYLAGSVWESGKLQGQVISVIGEYDFSQVKYCDNPLNEKCAVGLPGKEFSISGPHAKRFSYSSDDLIIKTLFPTSQNYSYRVEHKTGNVKDISVFDKNNKRVFWHLRVPGRNDLLSTYEYDENGKLVKSLPPLYHEKVGTFYKLISQFNSTSIEEKTLQDTFGVNISYDDKGNIITKSTPDTGKIENLYDKYGFLKFALHYSDSKIGNIIYFDYDELGRLKSTGEVISSTPKEELLTQLSDNNIRVYQEFYYSDSERDPLLRGKVTRTITFNGEESLIEESELNIGEETVSKRIIIPTKEKPVLIEVNKEYKAGKLREMEYPMDMQEGSFRLTFQYNKLGRVTGIGVPGKDNFFASFTYNSAGQVISEAHLPESVKNFTRQYAYNTAGFLTSLKDKFLAEEVHYTEEGYGGYGYGDGTVTRTEFKATWHENCDNSKLGLDERSFVNRDTTPEQSATCFQELKNKGYLNERGHQTKVYYSGLEYKLPIICSFGPISRHIQNILGKEGFPTQYGHIYDYGNYQELTKAKYFVGKEVPEPLQPDSFAKEISGINKTASRDIFEKLKNSKYLIQNNDKLDVSLAHSKGGKSFIRSKLSNDLKNVISDYERYRLPLEKFLIKCFSEKTDLTSMKMNFPDAFVRWSSNKIAQKTVSQVLEMLEKEGYLQNPLAIEFFDALNGYHSFIHDIVRVLSEHFAKCLGKAEFDVESYSIDANGNHKHFYTGFDRYEISYINNTNQISTVRFQSFVSSRKERSFLIKHDSRGNVVQAMHKGIEEIVYHPLSNRATKIKLTEVNTR